MVAKLSILSVENPSGSVTAIYNPKDISFTKTVDWSPDNQGLATDFPALQFTKGNAIEVSAELYFDKYEEKQDVRGDIQTLISFCLRHEQKNPRDIRPPKVKLKWGDQEILNEAVIKSVQVKYTMFLSDGTPCRATATVSMTEADVVSSGGGANGPKVQTFPNAASLSKNPDAMKTVNDQGIDVTDSKNFPLTVEVPDSSGSNGGGDN